MAVTTEMRTQVTQLYVSLFGRAPDSEGLGFWTQALSNGASLASVANSMYGVEPARSYYPLWMTNQEIVGSFYLNVLGRPADAEGLAFWTAKMNAPGATPGSVILQIIDVVDHYTGTDPAGLTSAALFDNKVAVALAYAMQVGTIDNATIVLANVTADPASVAAALAQISGATFGETFVLTTGQDTIFGTDGGDTINGFVNYDVSYGTTLNSSDFINGGKGFDVLNVTIEYESDNDLHLNMTNVEKMVITDFDGQDFYVEGVTGLNTVSIKGGSSSTDFEDGTYIIPNIEFHNTDNWFEQYAGDAAVINALNVLVDNSDVGLYTYSDTAHSRANYNNANITSVGAGYLALDDGTRYNELWMGESQGLGTVTVTGTTNINLEFEHWYAPSGPAGSIHTINAGALAAGLGLEAYFNGVAGAVKTVTGGLGNDLLGDYSDDSGLVINYATGTGNDWVLYNGGGATNKYIVDLGAGDDRVYAGDLLAAGDLLDGGIGSDGLGLTSAAAVAASALTGAASTAYQALFSNFEGLGIGDALVGAIDMAKLDGMQFLKLTGGVGGASSVAGLTSGAAIEINADGGSTLTVTLTGAAANPTDVLNLILNGSGSMWTTVEAASVETLNIKSTTTNTSPASVWNDLHLAAGAHTTLNIGGNANLELDHVDLTSVKTVNAGTLTGALDISLVGNLNNVTVTTGIGDDYVVGGDGNDIIKVGNGANTVSGGLGLDTLTGGTGVDTYLYGAAAESQGVTVDVITNFTSGVGGDVLDFSALVFGGAAAYVGAANGYGAVLTSLAAGSSNAVLDSTTSILYLDVDANGVLDNNDMAIQLTGVVTGPTGLGAANFVF